MAACFLQLYQQTQTCKLCINKACGVVATSLPFETSNLGVKCYLQQVGEPEAKDAGVKRRIDSGGLRREGLFAAADDWLNESEVSTFITGGAPAEAGGETSKQDQDIVKVIPAPHSYDGMNASVVFHGHETVRLLDQMQHLVLCHVSMPLQPLQLRKLM